MRLVSVQLGACRRIGPHRIEVETQPSWWARLWGAQPRRIAYEGGIVWRNAETGARANLELEDWLEEQAAQALFLAAKEGA